VAFKSLDEAETSRSIQQQGRWPLSEDENSTFSLLVKAQQGTVSAPHESNTNVNGGEDAVASGEPGLEDFLDCESLTEDDSDCSPEASPSPTTPSLAESPSTFAFWSEKNIPICGYRCRNDSNTMVSFPPPNRARLLAALSSIEGADYQQAVIVANGMNRRSLLSGKARQMFA
jgi:hypothetical protein